MKQYREGKELMIQHTLSSTIVEAPRPTIEGNADLKRGSVCTDFVFATSVYFLSAKRKTDSFKSNCIGANIVIFAS